MEKIGTRASEKPLEERDSKELGISVPHEEKTGKGEELW